VSFLTRDALGRPKLPATRLHGSAESEAGGDPAAFLESSRRRLETFCHWAVVRVGVPRGGMLLSVIRT
jgi:hypothetical protein